MGEMGLTRNLAVTALRVHRGNTGDAISWLLAAASEGEGELGGAGPASGLSSADGMDDSVERVGDVSGAGSERGTAAAFPFRAMSAPTSFGSRAPADNPSEGLAPSDAPRQAAGASVSFLHCTAQSLD